MLTYKEFKEMVLKTVTGELSYSIELFKDANVSIITVNKPGDIKKEALTLKFNNNLFASPTIYLEPIFEDFTKAEPFIDTKKEIQWIKETFMPLIFNNKMDINKIYQIMNNYESVKPHLFVELLNTESNMNYLADAVTKQILNLSLVVRVAFDMKNEDENRISSVVVKKNMISKWGITSDQLFVDAIENFPTILPMTLYSFDDVEQAILEKRDITEVEWYSNLRYTPFIVSNSRKLYGAAAMVQDDFFKEMVYITGESFYVIPSSIHDLIILPKSFVPNDNTLNEMVQEVNKTQVEPEERLSDFAYYYDYTNQKLSIVK